MAVKSEEKVTKPSQRNLDQVGSVDSRDAEIASLRDSVAELKAMVEMLADRKPIPATDTGLLDGYDFLERQGRVDRRVEKEAEARRIRRLKIEETLLAGQSRWLCTYAGEPRMSRVIGVEYTLTGAEHDMQTVRSICEAKFKSYFGVRQLDPAREFKIEAFSGNLPEWQQERLEQLRPE